jgi:hypothetical protein
MHEVNRTRRAVLFQSRCRGSIEMNRLLITDKARWQAGIPVTGVTRSRRGAGRRRVGLQTAVECGHC